MADTSFHLSGDISKLFEDSLGGFKQLSIYFEKVFYILELYLHKVLVDGLIHVLNHLLDERLAQVATLSIF
jgi:hypothetical protein